MEAMALGEDTVEAPRCGCRERIKDTDWNHLHGSQFPPPENRDDNSSPRLRQGKWKEFIHARILGGAAKRGVPGKG